MITIVFELFVFNCFFSLIFLLTQLFLWSEFWFPLSYCCANTALAVAIPVAKVNQKVNNWLELQILFMAERSEKHEWIMPTLPICDLSFVCPCKHFANFLFFLSPYCWSVSVCCLAFIIYRKSCTLQVIHSLSEGKISHSWSKNLSFLSAINT